MDEAAFVVDGDGGSVFDCLGDVVDRVDVLAEDFGGVFVGLLDRGACEADEGRVGEGVADVFGEAVAGLFADFVAVFVFDRDLFGFEAILAAVGFVGEDDDVGAIADLGVDCLVVLWGEFLDGGEDDAAGVDIEQLADGVTIARLLGGLAQELAASGEGVEELVVEVVAIGEDDEGGVIELEDEFAAEEDHREGFAAALGVPDDAALAGGGVVACGGSDNALDGLVDGVVLVIGGEFFDGLEADDRGFGVFGFDFFKDGEVADQVEQGAFVEHPLGEDGEFVGVGIVVDVAVGEGAFPLAEAVVIGGEGAAAGGDAVGDD